MKRCQRCLKTLVPFANNPEGFEVVSTPETALAVGVIERTVVDALNVTITGVSRSDRLKALSDIFSPDLSETYGFFWWLSCAYDDPERILADIRMAIIDADRTIKNIKAMKSARPRVRHIKDKSLRLKRQRVCCK